MTPVLSAPVTDPPDVRRLPGKNSPALKIPYSLVSVLVFPLSGASVASNMASSGVARRV